MARWLINYANVSIILAAESDEAEVLLAEALVGLNMVGFDFSDSHSNKPEPLIELSVSHHDKLWRLTDSTDGGMRTLKQVGDLIYHLTDRIVFHVADKTQGQHCVHAAAVAIDGRAIMIPADSGSGKSSFTAWLVANGFGYLSDELVLIDADAKLTGIARPIQIKAHGIAAIEPLLTVGDEKILSGGFANAVTVKLLGGGFAEPSPELAAFVFPKYTADSGFSFKQLSSADAGMRLMANHVNARNLEGHGFKRMMELIRNTPCYALDYGGFDTLPELFANTLRKITAQ